MGYTEIDAIDFCKQSAGLLERWINPLSMELRGLPPVYPSAEEKAEIIHAVTEVFYSMTCVNVHLLVPVIRLNMQNVDEFMQVPYSQWDTYKPIIDMALNATEAQKKMYIEACITISQCVFKVYLSLCKVCAAYRIGFYSVFQDMCDETGFDNTKHIRKLSKEDYVRFRFLMSILLGGDA